MIKCLVEGCDAPAKYGKAGRCGPHYYRHYYNNGATASRYGQHKVCAVTGCGNPPRTKGMCQAHYYQAWKQEMKS